MTISISITEAPYIENQLSKMANGEVLHPSTKQAMKRRGYADNLGRLTPQGHEALQEARRINLEGG